MARKTRDERIDTRTARLKLKPRSEPYWRVIQAGRAIGYRRISGRAGTWVARWRDPRDGQRRYQALGPADDFTDADHGTTLTFADAQTKAAEWFLEVARQSGQITKPVTVRVAVDHYLQDYSARGGKAPRFITTTMNAHVLPRLGDTLVADLTTAALRNWHNSLATAPARLRAGPKTTERKFRQAADQDAKRARRATANNILTMLKAALNLAYREGRVSSDDAWRRLRPFQRVGAARVRYLTDEEALRLVNACQPDLRSLVVAALLTGCRYQELATLRPADVDLDAGVLTVRHAKGGRPRSVTLTHEAVQFFRQTAVGRARDAILLPRADGSPWGRSHQFRPLRAVCKAASVTPAIGMHVLRHTHASRLARAGVPMAVIAAQLGHTSVRVTEAHYVHLAPTHISAAIRSGFADLGIVPATNISPIRPGGAAQQILDLPQGAPHND